MMLQFFFKDIEIFYKREKNILIEVICGVRVRKQIIKFLKQKIRKNNPTVGITPLVSNGFPRRQLATGLYEYVDRVNRCTARASAGRAGEIARGVGC